MKNSTISYSSLTLKPLSKKQWESCIESIKTSRFQTPQIRDALLKLVEINDVLKINSGIDCLATYELENFEFLLSMIIWYIWHIISCKLH